MENLQGSYCLKNNLLDFLFTKLIFLHYYLIKIPPSDSLLNHKIIPLVLVNLNDLHKVGMAQFLQYRQLVLEQVDFLGIQATFPYNSNVVLVLVPVGEALSLLAHRREPDDGTEGVVIVKEAPVFVNEVLTIPKQLLSDHLHLANSILILLPLPLACCAAAHFFVGLFLQSRFNNYYYKLL